MDVANESATLGKIMSDESIVKNTQRSIFKNHNMKVSYISDFKYLSKLSPDDLMGSLFTFEMILNRD